MNKEIKSLAMAMFLIVSIVLSGCQKNELEKKNDTIKIIEDGNQKSVADTDQNLEKEFNDSLDQALDELDQTENISNP